LPRGFSLSITHLKRWVYYLIQTLFAG